MYLVRIGALMERYQLHYAVPNWQDETRGKTEVNLSENSPAGAATVDILRLKPQLAHLPFRDVGYSGVTPADLTMDTQRSISLRIRSENAAGVLLASS